MADHKMTLRQSLRETALPIFLALWMALTPAFAFAGSMTLLGVGKATAAAPTFVGLGDLTFSTASPLVGGSCARVYKASQASTSTSMCDLVAVTGGAAVCTLRATTTGYVDLTAYCPGSLTPVAACAAASGGSCRLTKLYDLVAGTNPFTNATLASMPPVVFSTLNGLPAIQCVSASSTNLTSTSAVTINQPYYLTAVFERTGSFTSLANALGASGVGLLFGSNSTANHAILSSSGAPTMIPTMSDGTGPSDFTNFHSMTGVLNNTTSFLTVDGVDTSGSVGTANITAIPLRFCRGNAAATPDGYVMEGYFGPSATSLSSGDRTAINSNQHSATSGYNF